MKTIIVATGLSLAVLASAPTSAASLSSIGRLRTPVTRPPRSRSRRKALRMQCRDRFRGHDGWQRADGEPASIAGFCIMLDNKTTAPSATSTRRSRIDPQQPEAWLSKAIAAMAARQRRATRCRAGDQVAAIRSQAAGGGLFDPRPCQRTAGSAQGGLCRPANGAVSSSRTGPSRVEQLAALQGRQALSLTPVNAGLRPA